MKKALFLFVFGILFSCNINDDDSSETNTELVGTWKLVEILADPGDGSGTFQPVTSDKIITFHSDGTLTSNGIICQMSLESDTATSATYSEANSTITTNYCSTPNTNDVEYHFVHDGEYLTISFFCIEPCKAKYKKQ